MTHLRVTFATVLTMLRIVLVPVFGVLWATSYLKMALVVFLVAALTDLADGFIARYFHQRSDLGALLDPAADKLMLLVSYLVAAATATVPPWLAALVIGRDMMILFFAGVLKMAFPGRHDPESWRPTKLGKYATFSHTLVIAAALVTRAFAVRVLEPWLHTIIVAAAILTIASTIQYVATGIMAMRGGGKGPAEARS